MELNPDKADITVKFRVGLKAENKIDLDELVLDCEGKLRFDVGDDAEMRNVAEIHAWETVKVEPIYSDHGPTLLLFKPDAVGRGLIPAILTRLSCHGLYFDSMVRQDFKDDARVGHRLEDHYREHKGREYYDQLIAFMKSGPFYAVSMKRHAPTAPPAPPLPAFAVLREAMGSYKDRTSKTIRGTYMQDGCPLYENLLHGSDSEAEARRELDIWFHGKYR